MRKQKIDPHFYGRRHGRPLRKDSKEAIEKTLPLLQFDADNLPQDVFSFVTSQTQNNKELWLEIGFGNGEHFAELVKHHSEKAFIGCEPFINGVAHCIKNMNKQVAHTEYAQRVRLWTDSAEGLLDTLPNGCISRLYLLNPDPWPKARHHKRRFVNSDNLDRIARILKTGGSFITATDVSNLAEWMLEKTLAHKAFEWTALCKGDWQKRPSDWMITTRYAAKGEEAGRKEIYLNFLRK